LLYAMALGLQELNEVQKFGDGVLD